MKRGILPGRLWRLSGFRWIFPIGTLPIPYHPLFALALLVGAPAWIIWLGRADIVDAARATRWWQPLLVALILGMPMSVPIIAWVMMAFRAHLLQAILIAGAMALLALDVAAGRVAPGWAVLPAGFVLLYAVQRIGGRILLARLRRRAGAWTPIGPVLTTVAIDGVTFTTEQARHLIERCDIARISSQHAMRHWLSRPAIEALRAACEGAVPPGWSLPAGDGAGTVTRPLDPLSLGTTPPDCLTVTIEPLPVPLGLVSGPLERLTVHGPGIDRQIIWGRARIVGRIPAFTAFRWTAIFGGRSAWHIGFMRDKEVTLGPPGNDQARLRHVFVARLDSGGRVDDDWLTSGPAPLLGLIACHAGEERARIDAFWHAIAADPGATADPAVMRRLRDHPALVRSGDGKRLAVWLSAAKDARNRLAAINAAVLLERLPEQEFRAAASDIAAALNSRILAGEWRIDATLDLADVPRDCPRFGGVGGFGLMRHVPRLYDRLAAIGPVEAEFVTRLRATLLRDQ